MVRSFAISSVCDRPLWVESGPSRRVRISHMQSTASGLTGTELYTKGRHHRGRHLDCRLDR